jgi:hypothetical protein
MRTSTFSCRFDRPLTIEESLLQLCALREGLLVHLVVEADQQRLPNSQRGGAEVPCRAQHRFE